jgi:IS1 family transposase/transposase-like protein
MATKKPIHQLSIAQFEHHFPDEDACCAYLVGKRWPKGVRCPRCGAENPTKLKGNPWHWQCYQCAPQSSYRFSHITGTIFENTNKPLRDWFRVIHLMLTSKKGISALQIYRYMGFGSYKTAWYMAHRIRAALASQKLDKLGGVVEVDETFVGGKAKNRHDRGGGHGTGGIGSGKTPIAGAVSRKGNVVARVIANVRASTLTAFVHEAVSHKVSLLCTDQWVGYKHLGDNYPHAVIDHARGEYVIGAVHTNTIEGFWSILRGVVGSFHKRSAANTYRSMLQNSNSDITIARTRTFSERRLRDAET